MSFLIKQNDRSPSITCNLTVGADAVQLSGTVVRFILRKPGAATPKVNALATVVGDGTSGDVRYDWAVGDTDTSGLYLAEWEISFGGGVKRTFPVEDYLYVNITPDLG